MTGEQVESVCVLASLLHSNRSIAHQLHLSRTTVAKALEGFIRPLCACGRTSNHSGWCTVRNNANPARQAFMMNTFDTWKHRRILRAPLDFTGQGGVAIETIVIKAPVKPKPEEAKQAPPDDKKKRGPFSMLAMRGPDPYNSIKECAAVQHHRAHV